MFEWQGPGPSNNGKLTSGTPLREGLAPHAPPATQPGVFEERTNPALLTGETRVGPLTGQLWTSLVENLGHDELVGPVSLILASELEMKLASRSKEREFGRLKN